MTYIEPLLLLCGAVALVGFLRPCSSKAHSAGVAGLLGLLLFSWPPVDWLLARPLEARYPLRPFKPPPDTQAIVVLGSAVRPPQYERPYPMPDVNTFSRCEHAAWIYRVYGPLPVLACQGRQQPASSKLM